MPKTNINTLIFIALFNTFLNLFKGLSKSINKYDSYRYY